MQDIKRDEKYPDLVWVTFEGPAWDDFHTLMEAFEKFTEESPTPFHMVFYPIVDMPKGSPLPHIQRMIRFMNNNPKIEHMITILPRKMIIAKMFANIAMKLFPGQQMKASIITDKEKVHEVYEQVVEKLSS